MGRSPLPIPARLSSSRKLVCRLTAFFETLGRYQPGWQEDDRPMPIDRKGDDRDYDLMIDPEIAFLARMIEPEKLLPPLPGVSDISLDQLLKITPNAMATVFESIDAEAMAMAKELLTHPRIPDLLDRFLARGYKSITAVGDSLTADRGGWFEILRRMIALRSSDPVLCVNAACTGETSVQMLARMPEVAASGPDLILCVTPVNDTRHFGGPSIPAQLSVAASLHSLAAARAIIESKTRWIAMTCPGIDEVAANAHPFWARLSVHWSRQDADTLAEAIMASDSSAIDLRPPVTPAEFWEADGVHLAKTGKRHVIGKLLEAA